MNVPANDPHAAADSDLGIDAFRGLSDELGLSLEELGATYAELLGGGAVPYADEPEAGAEETEDDAAEDIEASAEADAEADHACDLSPRSILEAMLFVGHPDNEPFTSKQAAALMRGVRPAEIDELVVELNELYASEDCPYRIVSVGTGYRMDLRPEMASLRDKFYGRVREAKLSQGAIDVLAVVAYNQGINRQELDELRGKPSGGLLNQLVRRELLRVERPTAAPRVPRYFTTKRFLEIFELDGLDSLPQAHEMDRSF